MTTAVTKAQYAKQRNLSRQAVYKAVADGRLDGAIMPDGKVNVELADQLWAANTNPNHGYHAPSRVQKRRGAPPDDDLKSLAASVGVDLANIPSLNDSVAVKEAYKAQLARIEYEEKSGKLIDQDLVKKQAFKLARLTRDAMLAIPDRVSAEIAGMTDPFEIHRKITDEVRMAIAEISKEIDGD